MDSLPRTHTGVEGLDQLLRGGLPRRRLHLIEGEPGSGKTTLALQFLLEGRRAGERGLYVTLSETVDELRDVATSHGWTLEGIDLHQLSAGSERVADEYTLYHPAEIELGALTKAVLDHVERAEPARVVIDSLSELRLLARDPLRYRREILGLKAYFSQRSATVLLLDDHSGESDAQLRSIAHGVVLLEHLPFEYGRARRRLRIVKLRGTAVTEGFHDFLIARGGLVVFPQLVPDVQRGPRPSAPIASGLAELDALVGGGLSWGTTTLFVGPAGAGKSTVAAQYLCGAANLDARSAVFLFDERLSTFVARCDALGMRASERIASGHLEIHQVDPGVSSPGEFSHTVRRYVEDRGVQIVGIDTLNGYLNAIPSTDAPVTRLHELLSFLNERGVATLVVLAQHGIVGAAMPTPIDLSYLADAIVLLRFFESQGLVRKAISVVKKRTGLHETSIRELMISPGGLRVGPPLTQFQGVLTGVPTYVGSDVPLMSDDQRRERH